MSEISAAARQELVRAVVERYRTGTIGATMPRSAGPSGKLSALSDCRVAAFALFCRVAERHAPTSSSARCFAIGASTEPEQPRSPGARRFGRLFTTAVAAGSDHRPPGGMDHRLRVE